MKFADIGFGRAPYLAHITISYGRHSLWLNIISTNWNSFTLRRDFRGSYMGCLSVFTFALTH